METKETVFYLDENDNIVGPEEATHVRIRETDAEGNLIREHYLVRRPKAEEQPPPPKEFFIGELYFGNDAIRRESRSGFGSVEEMDREMIRRWNATVAPTDIVWVLGALGLTKGEEMYFPKLNGKKYLVKSAFDFRSDEEYRKAGFEKIYDLPVLHPEGWILSASEKKNLPIPNVFGDYHVLPKSRLSVCVAANICCLRPVILSTIKEQISKAERESLTRSLPPGLLEFVLIFDVSAEMGRMGAEGKTLLENAKDQAVELIKRTRELFLKHHPGSSCTVRVRVIIFGSYRDLEDAAIKVTDFTDLSDDEDWLRRILSKTVVSEVSKSPSAGLEALAYAIRSDWTGRRTRVRRSILLWSAGVPAPLGECREEEWYPKGMPESFEKLTEFWAELEDLNPILFLAAPDEGAWSVFSDQWSSVVHYPSKAGQDMAEAAKKDVVLLLADRI